MATHQGNGSPPPKRRKLDANLPNKATTTEDPDFNAKGIDRPISPPLLRRKSPVASPLFTATWGFDDVPKQPSALESSTSDTKQERIEREESEGTRFLPSPVQLTRVEDLGPHQNVDAVGLKDILGDPMIRECWNFNFLFDLDFVMKQFDSDVRDMVIVKIVHGFWKRDDERRIALLEAAERFPNIELLSAYIPNPFGTHHSKMLILFRHDGLAQVVIHTANMISRDWGNMTQAAWTSPLLPLLPPKADPSLLASQPEATFHAIGTGERFKVDLLRYLGAYERRAAGLTKQLATYDFSGIKAAFIGSAPSHQRPSTASSSRATSFGWLGLQEILSNIPVSNSANADTPPHIVVQVSSIATLGPTPTWLTHFESVLAQKSSNQLSTVEPSTFSSKATFFAKRDPSSLKLPKKIPIPKFNIIFPTPDEIRTSLDGYASGASIHMKLQSVQQQKQSEYLHPLLCYWKHTPTDFTSKSWREAHRGPAAPHIKTYTRFSDDKHKTIDWAMVTSANLSKQAWGDVVNKKEEIWIQSWEAGVVVWPALFAALDSAKEQAEARNNVIMVPVFGKDLPRHEDLHEGEGGTETLKTVVGFRMPYSLPLSSYKAEDMPWCATMKYSEPDWKGLSWGGYGN
ncbi:tyrosyl-DNA phosphodiesterase 1 [Cucurbitaria berberidis CBS 394.84]|uniref:Tyrosyl-DNA phosphodiesterase 1 n=1 Tax=Cucurbitaria berberidis CBS 394.84 TaxID=1168544 RepID=A0A9P4GD60_9PLEO|nr:tyrosyl-DNA phosphodiesterase 1 [Cucurbitaria berberidis CBS 394.84]KAF1843452.1 tyrosyl-DNA phosphodiesterase 1 [Cucurbitaria berberidis CBS 394.84]